MSHSNIPFIKKPDTQTPCSYQNGTGMYQAELTALQEQHGLAYDQPTLHGQLLRYALMLQSEYFYNQNRDMTELSHDEDNPDTIKLSLTPFYSHALAVLCDHIYSANTPCDWIKHMVLAIDETTDMAVKIAINDENTAIYNHLMDKVIIHILTTEDSPTPPNCYDAYGDVMEDCCDYVTLTKEMDFN